MTLILSSSAPSHICWALQPPGLSSHWVAELSSLRCYGIELHMRRPKALLQITGNLTRWLIRAGTPKPNFRPTLPLGFPGEVLHTWPVRRNNMLCNTVGKYKLVSLLPPPAQMLHVQGELCQRTESYLESFLHTDTSYPATSTTTISNRPNSIKWQACILPLPPWFPTPWSEILPPAPMTEALFFSLLQIFHSSEIKVNIPDRGRL